MNPPLDYSLEVCSQCHFQYASHTAGDLQACLRAANLKLQKPQIPIGWVWAGAGIGWVPGKKVRRGNEIRIEPCLPGEDRIFTVGLNFW